MALFRAGEPVAARFVIEGRLASGGMAEVFVARMELGRGVSRRVALKRIHPHLAEDPDFVTMFVDEARVLSHLAHPGIVSVVDVVEERGEVMMVLEYVPGWDLGAVLKEARRLRRSVPVELAVDVCIRLAETLAYVHDARDAKGESLHIVHRDVTPSNVLLGADGSVRLLDFGVAKAAQRATRTATNSLKGKLAYMAPEQASGAPVDHRTDIYALGMVLYEALTGRRVITGRDEIALIAAAQRPRVEPVQDVRAEVPEDVAETVHWMLSPKAADRPSDATEVATSLLEAGRTLPAHTATRLRSYLESVMGTSSRPVQAARRSLDDALARVAGFAGSKTHTTRSLLGGGDPWSKVTEVARYTVEVDTEPNPVPGQPMPATEAPVDTEQAPEERGSPPTESVHIPVSRGPRLFLIAAAVLLLVAGGAAALFATLGGSAEDATDRAARPPVAQAGQRAPAPATAQRRGFLRVTSEPAGATVTVDGEPWPETTPTIVESPAGEERRIELALADHADVAAAAVAEPGETVAVHRELPRLGGALEVTSIPSGAEVVIDGEVAGTTPLSVGDLPREELQVEVRRRGHRSFTRAVDLSTEREQSLEARLDARMPRGQLWVNADVPRATVRVDGRTVARSVPWRGTVRAGRRTVTATDPSTGATATEVVRVSPDGVARVGLYLRR